jgi:hypothetical protein
MLAKQPEGMLGFVEGKKLLREKNNLKGQARQQRTDTSVVRTPFPSTSVTRQFTGTL